MSFENSLCLDYITEKFFKALSYDIIPVVLNGANMTNIAPHHSFINVRDFHNISGDKKVQYDLLS